jgi:chondroitin AC lyase
MKGMVIYFLLCLVLRISAEAQNAPVSSYSATASDEIEQLKENFIRTTLFEGEDELIKRLMQMPEEELVADQVVAELTQRYPVEKGEIQSLLDSFQQDGSWSDIVYNSRERGGWQPAIHADRIFVLTKAYCLQNSPFYHSPELKESIHKALGHWFSKKYIARNWWYNQVGVPKTLGAVFILLENELSPAEREGAIEVMSRSVLGTTGQNKVWQAGNVFIRALLQSDLELALQARDTIVSEIVIEKKSYGKNEGIRKDFSYHQHGEQQQYGNYGAAYLQCMSVWAKTFKGTSLMFDQAQLDILSNLITKGFQRVLWNGYMDVNVLGRQFFQQAQRHKAISVAFAARNLADCDPKNRDKYLKLIDENFYGHEHPSELNGLYHFQKSDQTIYRTPHWMASIRMSSPGTIGGEAGNGDNLKGYYMSDGATYVYVDGSEYDNIFPAWEWRRLPGVTAFDSAEPLKELNFAGYWNQSHFVGNVTDGKTGITTFQLQRDGLNAAKSWIITPKYILCLGAGIQTTRDSLVTSSINQCLQRSDLQVYENRKWQKVTDLTMEDVDDKRFFHDKTGYIVLDASLLNVISERRTGSWHDIMSCYPEDMISSEDVVSIWIDHGVQPRDAHYQYLILPASTREDVAGFKLNEIQIIENTKHVQAVYIPEEKMVYVAAYENAKLDLPNKTSFICERGLYMIQLEGKQKNLQIHACDPIGEKKVLSVKLNNVMRDIQTIY